MAELILETQILGEHFKMLSHWQVLGHSWEYVTVLFFYS